MALTKITLMYFIVIYFLNDAKIPYLLSQNPVIGPFAFVP